ncbi:hypothetical protein A1O3_00741 [Capronia epimyces CBS 606.96]|uniref:Uncharacterized protein n=1 Tax=Capronia epimyces CBS 606.96 TaxID=1182542 RepID=W9YSF0_9EURO|nr:uncharacterized protein A1O3_00741 [Capronia epimyces CBS 606.96]EXJ92191.1 hypothetical protein A1O3_00741 [Capronia epimyces CBS 606.96]
MPKTVSRKRRASHMDDDKENHPPAVDSESATTGMTLMKSKHKNARDGKLARQSVEKDPGRTSSQLPSTPTSKVTKPSIRDRRPTPGRKVPPRGSPPNAFRPEIDPERMRNPKPLPPPAKKRGNSGPNDDRFKKEALRDPNHTFHDLYVCYKKGPRGSPTYDRAWFQLDYHKVAEWMKPKVYNKRSMMRSMEIYVERAQQEQTKMAEIFFLSGTVPKDVPARDVAMWKDRVSKDLDIPFHKIDVAAFEEWERRGFEKQLPSDWTWTSLSDEEKERLFRLGDGLSLRK